jgi:hypothetical protein
MGGLRLQHIKAPHAPYGLDPTAVAVENNSHLYYQRYVFDQIATEARHRGIYAILAVPVDFLYGLLGLYFLRPQSGFASSGR